MITSDEAWFYLSNNQGKTRGQYIKKTFNRSVAETVSHVSHPKGTMVWVAFAADGFFTPIFVNPGAKINASYYCKNVLEPFSKEFHERYRGNDRLFQQDPAPAHTAKLTLKFQKEKNIPFLRPDQWMPSSPDCAPYDYWLCGYLKNRVNSRKINTVKGLQKAIKEEVKIPIPMIMRALKSWPKRCRKVYYSKEGHIKNFKNIDKLYRS